MAAIRANLDTFAQAILAADWAALTALYTEGAVFMAPNQPALEGRAAIRAWLEPLPPIVQYEPTIVEIDGRGDLAFVRGTYSETYTVEGAPEPIHDTGKYVRRDLAEAARRLLAHRGRDLELGPAASRGGRGDRGVAA